MRRTLSLLLVLLSSVVLTGCAMESNPSAPSLTGSPSSTNLDARATTTYSFRIYGWPDKYLPGSLVDVTTSQGTTQYVAEGWMAKVSAVVPKTDTTIDVVVTPPSPYCPWSRTLTVSELKQWNTINVQGGC